MTDLKVHILGCGSATPTARHLPSCQALEFRGRTMLIDCGEGAQLSTRRKHLHFSRITDVFISHLHGDHLLGLPGLLSTLSLHNIGGKVTIHIFEEGAEMLRHVMRVVTHQTSFVVDYNIISPDGGILLDDKSMTVKAFPLHHGVPCVGFRFDIVPSLPHLRGDMAAYHNIPVFRREAIRAGADFVKPDGTVVPNALLTTPATPSPSYAYCSDTSFHPSIAEHVRGVHTLYHESTYAADMADSARQRGHSTAVEAALTARDAGAQRLLIGHYSKRYPEPDLLLAQAKEVFANTVATDEGMTIDFD